jgi:hypothetical protein
MDLPTAIRSMSVTSPMISKYIVKRGLDTTAGTYYSTVKPVCCEALDFVRASKAEMRRT